MHPANNKIENVRRRAARARRFPENTCPASRHVMLMADRLSRQGSYPMLQDEPEHCAGSLYSVLESLFKARTELTKLKQKTKGATNKVGGGTSHG